jgi:hypothetical protein
MRRLMALLGSASGCKYRLADPSVSRFHASLLRTGSGLWVVDLLSHTGITVNDASIRSGRVENGDVLGVGRYRIRIRCGWQSQESDSRAPGSSSISLAALRVRSRDSNRLQLPDWAAAVLAPEREAGTARGVESPLPAQITPVSSGIEVMSSETAYPIKPAQSEWTESMLIPLVNQFGLMQQQMFDQFQQAMSMLVQMFGKMHRDQMDVIRAELDKLHELTDELQSLKDELAKRVPAHSQPVSSGRSGDPAALDQSGSRNPGSLTDLSAVEPPLFRSQAKPANRPPRAQAVRSSPPAFTTPPPPASLATKHGLPDETQPSPTSDLLPSEPTSAALRSKQPQSSSPFSQIGSDGPVSADSDKDTLMWLHERIATIQRERESRWQKILKLLPGVS